MSNEVLYRKYRPKNFDDLVGHNYFKSIIINELKNKKLSHAIILNGQRGTGKTSAARLIAKCYSCLQPIDGYKSCDICQSCSMFVNNSHPDIFEIDAASNNGIDEIRNIKENISSSPIVSKYKIYIIDEVHMLTSNAFNAFLKTLEEPPGFVIFILATTEIHLVPQTILSRCQLYNFVKLTYNDVETKITEICKLENFKISKEVIKEIYNSTEGSMRDALNILEQLRNFNLEEISINDYNNVFISLNQYEKINFINIVLNNDVKQTIYKINDYEEKGINFKNLTISLISILKSYIQYFFTMDKSFIETLSFDEINLLKKHKIDKIINLINVLIKIYEEEKNSPILPTTILMNAIKSISLINEIIKSDLKPSLDIDTKQINQNINLKNVNKTLSILKESKIESQNIINSNNKIKKQTNLIFKDEIIFNILINRKAEAKSKFENIINNSDTIKLGKLSFLLNAKIIAAIGNAFIFLMKKNENENVMDYSDIVNKKFHEKIESVFGYKVAIIQIYHTKIDYYKSKVDVLKNKFENLYINIDDYFLGKYCDQNKTDSEKILELKSIFPKLEVK